MHLSLFISFCPPNILVCPPNIFDKSMSVLFLQVLPTASIFPYFLAYLDVQHGSSFEMKLCSHDSYEGCAVVCCQNSFSVSSHSSRWITRLAILTPGATASEQF